MLNVNRSFICIFSDKLKDTALNGLHETKSTLVKEVYYSLCKAPKDCLPV